MSHDATRQILLKDHRFRVIHRTLFTGKHLLDDGFWQGLDLQSQLITTYVNELSFPGSAQ